jgi:hypothetical protein
MADYPVAGPVRQAIPPRPVGDPAHPLGTHRRRISDRTGFDKLIQVLGFGCDYEAIADTTCSASTIRNRRDEWTMLGIVAQLKQIALQAYDRIVGLLEQIAVDGCITKALVVASASAHPRSITIRSLVRTAWTLDRWDTRPVHRPGRSPHCAAS